MGKKLGNDYRLLIDSATPGTPAMIKGQQDLSISQSGGTIDTTSKDDYPYGTAAPSTRSISISVSLIPDLPDANGYARLEAVATAPVATPVIVEIRKGGASGGTSDIVFKGSVYITDFNQSFGQNDAVKATCTLVAASAPTINTLA